MSDDLPILIVDDEDKWRNKLKAMLVEVRYAVDSVSGLEEARERFQRGKRYAALTVDLRLGEDGAQGLELLRVLQFLESTRYSQGPAIVLSAYPDLAEESLQRGAYAFFNKALLPDQQREFLETIARAVEEGKQQIAALREKVKLEYQRLTKRFLRGKTISFSVPPEAENPWAKLASQR
ncbi:MAG TPA: response regulator [Anaerolineae bacterium]|nr:response regulator [Anaerolineae bacterium]